ncbi:ATP-binding protein [Victivallis sp. Marseille-Q1083]|uniref:sensor histidine kinase n=1 Tax=Victivallis sp. Marseille-Q1083 TaxID=2717288 RepID=UPI00158B88E6|nr:ATP-binding protein [Victivallis sp. Marseille-Q1083]
MNIKQKFLISFGILLLAFAVPGILMLRQVDKLGRAVDVILRENYQSVIICQNVNEALERIDSGLLFSFAGQTAAPGFFSEQVDKIEREWKAELDNITVPTEGARAEKVARMLAEYIALLPELRKPERPSTERMSFYREKAFPLFQELKQEIGGILTVNQNNMTEANNLARTEADHLFRRGIGLLIGCFAFIIVFSLLLTRWIQRPLQKLIDMTNEIANGNLALAPDSKSNDEIGQLARSFNAMAIALRNARSQLVGRLHRSEQMNKDVFSELPTPIAVFDIRSERIELATRSARQYFGLEEGRKLGEFSFEWLPDIFRQVRQNGVVSISGKNDGIIQHFIDGKEFFFQPMAVPLPADAQVEQLTGVVVILKDVTLAHEQQELKRSVISTVSHQLRTPLTSLQMSIYLLLEEKCGALNPDQLDLIMTMRDDSQRLTEIIGDLLDLNKASKPGKLVTEPHAPNELLLNAKDRFLAECQSHSITLETDCDPLAPAVPVALNRINYAFDNLIGNAVRFTPPGGKIRLSAKARDNAVEFAVSDTGCGMSEEVATHVFEPFYRGPGQDAVSGVGLGLAIVKEIITAHGGNINVRSKENTGTVFTFTLPTGGDQSCS